MAQSPRRQHQRLPCALAVSILAANGAKAADARLVDLSMGGASLECPVPLQRGVSYELKLPRGRILSWSFPVRVTWEGKPDPKTKAYRFGLVFVLTTKQEERLKQLFDELRQGLWSS